MSLSITAQHQFERCYNLNPIAIQTDDFEKEIKSHAYFLKDATRDLKFKDALQSLNNCEFLSDKDIGKLPDEFKSGRYHIWSFFKLSNESDEINKFILSGSIEPVSYTHLDVYKRQDMNKKQYRFNSDINNINSFVTSFSLKAGFLDYNHKEISKIDASIGTEFGMKTTSLDLSLIHI